MIPPEIATGIAVFIGGILTYEYSMWRTKRYIKKTLTETAAKYLPLISNILITQGTKKRPDDYD